MSRWAGNDYSDVDIQSLFTTEGIDYRTAGKNISRGWVGVNCPFCGEQNNHCGVNLDTKRYSCWVCSQSGTLVKLVAVYLNLDYKQANIIIDDYRGFRYDAPVRELSEQIILPTHITSLTKQGRKYLFERGFDPDYIIDKYKVRESNLFSRIVKGEVSWDFKCRIYIPIIMDREIKTYTGRDWTGKQDPRYRNAPLEVSTMETSECVYNIDTVVDRALIVEGPTDVWKLGDEAIATLGVKFSHAQINRILKKNLKKAVILFDSSAEQAASLLADTLCPFIQDLSVYTLKDQDPGSMSFVDAHKLKYDLLD